MKRALSITVLVVGCAAALSAHVMVSPPQSKPQATQTYELRVHNESKLATTAVELQIPNGLTVLSVQQPASGSLDTLKTGDRITAINWKVDVEPSKYVALKFEARNPASGELHWNVRQHMADGSIVDWSDAPGAKQKASVTTLGAPSTTAPDAGSHDAGTHDHPHN